MLLDVLVITVLLSQVKHPVSTHVVLGVLQHRHAMIQDVATSTCALEKQVQLVLLSDVVLGVLI